VIEPTEQPIPRETVYRSGVAKIVSNDGGGEYTITAQLWGGSAWEDSLDDSLVEAGAREPNADASLVADTLVFFFEQEQATGGPELLIFSPSSSQGGIDKWANFTGDGFVTISSADWRGYMLPVSVVAYDGSEASANSGQWIELANDAILAQVGMSGEAASTSQTTLWREGTGRSIEVFVDNAGSFGNSGCIILSVYSESYPMQLRVLVGHPILAKKTEADLDGPET
jgi:hypothetical protein